MGLNQYDNEGELIIEVQDHIFNIDEDNLRTPVSEDFEYEILIEGSSVQRWVIPNYHLYTYLSLNIFNYSKGEIANIDKMKG